MLFGFFEPDVPEIDARDVYASLKKHEYLLLIDVRSPEEHEKESIEKSLLVPIEMIDRDITTVAPKKAEKIIVYCLSGARSKVAVEKMRNMGYSNAFSMKSGLLAWRVYKFPTVP